MTGGPSRNFNPRAPCGARPETNKPLKTAGKFQSTRPVRGATSDGSAGRPCGPISIHAPRAGRDIYLVPQVGVLFVISIHAPRAGRDCGLRIKPRGKGISIHAPRAGRDGYRGLAIYFTKISIHAPRAGRDRRPDLLSGMLSGFQSTRPVRGATSGTVSKCANIYISIHAPRAGRDCW